MRGLSGLAGLLHPLSPLVPPSLALQPPRSLPLSLTGLAGLGGRLLHWSLQAELRPLRDWRSAALAWDSSRCCAAGSLRCRQMGGQGGWWVGAWLCTTELVGSHGLSSAAHQAMHALETSYPAAQHTSSAARPWLGISEILPIAATTQQRAGASNGTHQHDQLRRQLLAGVAQRQPVRRQRLLRLAQQRPVAGQLRLGGRQLCKGSRLRLLATLQAAPCVGQLRGGRRGVVWFGGARVVRGDGAAGTAGSRQSANTGAMQQSCMANVQKTQLLAQAGAHPCQPAADAASPTTGSTQPNLSATISKSASAPPACAGLSRGPASAPLPRLLQPPWRPPAPARPLHAAAPAPAQGVNRQGRSPFGWEHGGTGATRLMSSVSTHKCRASSWLSAAPQSIRKLKDSRLNHPPASGWRQII